MENSIKMSINFISSKDSDETPNMHTKSDNIKTMMGIETDDIKNELFESLLQKYQEGLENSIRGSKFIFDSVDLLYYNLQLELLESLLQKYQEGLEESMRASKFIFDSVELLYHNLQKASLNRKRSSHIKKLQLKIKKQQ